MHSMSTWLCAGIAGLPISVPFALLPLHHHTCEPLRSQRSINSQTQHFQVTLFAKAFRAVATWLHCHATSVVGIDEAVDTVMTLCVDACKSHRGVHIDTRASGTREGKAAITSNHSLNRVSTGGTQGSGQGHPHGNRHSTGTGQPCARSGSHLPGLQVLTGSESDSMLQLFQ
jgi:hypothetical protein